MQKMYLRDCDLSKRKIAVEYYKDLKSNEEKPQIVFDNLVNGSLPWKECIQELTRY